MYPPKCRNFGLRDRNFVEKIGGKIFFRPRFKFWKDEFKIILSDQNFLFWILQSIYADMLSAAKRISKIISIGATIP